MPAQRVTPRLARLLFIGLLGLLSISLAACDSGGGNGDDDEEEEQQGFPEPPGRPGFTSSFTGTVSLSVSGAALHGANLASGDGGAPRAFAIRLADEAARARETRIVLVSARVAVPRPGVYAVGAPADGPDFTAWVTLPGRPLPLRATAGTLEVLDRAGDTLAGRFRLEVSDAPGGPLAVSGAFRSTAAP